MAGDSVGATPPISNSFGDTPTIEVMNMMGIDIDGLGNHNFDRGADYLRNTLIPLANFPFVSANVVDADGNTPAEWSQSHVFDARARRQARLRRLHERRRADADQARLRSIRSTCRSATRRRGQRRGRCASTTRTDAIVAMGHDGATGGTLTSPTGPLVDLADNVSNVDAVIGDHTDFQVLTTRSNGVLVTENRSKGLRFTRVRLVIGPGKQGVVYKTADFHKPWNIGVTPDAAIQAQDRRAERAAAADPRHAGRRLRTSPCRGRLVRLPAPPDRPRRRPGLRVARRRHRHRRDAAAVQHGLRHHELRRAP